MGLVHMESYGTILSSPLSVVDNYLQNVHCTEPGVGGNKGSGGPREEDPTGSSSRVSAHPATRGLVSNPGGCDARDRSVSFDCPRAQFRACGVSVKSGLVALPTHH